MGGLLDLGKGSTQKEALTLQLWCWEDVALPGHSEHRGQDSAEVRREDGGQWSFQQLQGGLSRR